MSSSIDEKLADLSKTSNNQFIFRVHPGLRKHNEEAYEPEIISIGPYHHGKENLKKMEKYKHKYLQGILSRQREASAQRYIAALREEEKRARDCYAEQVLLSPDAFVEMMLLDGCFIIEFLRKGYGIVSKDDDPIFSMEWNFPVLCRDMLLFENQLPFFILEKLFDMTKIEEDGDSLKDLSISCLWHCLVPQDFSSFSWNIKLPDNGTFHLLWLMHEIWCSSFVEARDTQSQEEGGGHQRCFIQFCNRIEQVDDKDLMHFTKSVRELKKDYGIKFQTPNQSSSWLDIKFENGIMRIPILTVQDTTESILRNLIAHEQYMSFNLPRGRVITDYTIFIDSLINSSEDVQILCHEKIVTNYLGSDEMVAKIFNKIGNGVVQNSEEFSYWRIVRDVKKHCSRRRHRWIAELKKKYFRNPWAIVSFLAAILLLLLTFLQTIFAILQVVKETKVTCNCNCKI